MMRFLRSILDQPFITATGIAAFVHSTWTLATLFNGPEPSQSEWRWVAWVTPAALISFALDVGQIQTSAELRSGDRSWQKRATFGTFSLAVYFLQWWYLVHHMPLLPLTLGLREEWRPFANWLSDSALWVVPALLPLSTLLYTLSYSQMGAESAKGIGQGEQVHRRLWIHVRIWRSALTRIGLRNADRDRHESDLRGGLPSGEPTAGHALPSGADLALPSPTGTSEGSDGYSATCTACGYTVSGRASQYAADNAIRAHKRFCKGSAAASGGAGEVDAKQTGHSEISVVPVDPDQMKGKASQRC